MTSPVFKKTICLSLLGHLTVFTIFSFSFGRRIPEANYTSVSFWGGILNSYDLSRQVLRSTKFNKVFSKPLNIEEGFIKKIGTSKQVKTSQELTTRPEYYFKPSVDLVLIKDKTVYAAKPVTPPKLRKESIVMFHPVLPYHFTVYFKDRHTAHIELMFNIISSENGNSIVVKRRISSGNLEVDLLSMHYISHYLFIQQARFIPDKWQTVKIDLSQEK